MARSCLKGRDGAGAGRLLLALALGWTGGIVEGATPAETVAYAEALLQVQDDLEAGRAAEAVKKLDATDPQLRSFEYDYLKAVAARADADPAAAPDLVASVASPEAEMRYGALNEIDRRLVLLCRDGGLIVHDLTTPDAAPLTIPYPEGGPIWSGAFSGDGRTFFAGHEKGEVVVRDAATWEVRHMVKTGAEWPVRELAVAPDGSAFVAEGKDALQLWTLAGDTPRKVADVGERLNFGEGLAFSPKGDRFVTGGMFDIVFHDAATGAETGSVRHASYTMGLRFSPDGARVASAPRGNVNKFLSVFDAETKEMLSHAGPFPAYVAGMAFTPDGQRIAATGCDDTLRLFDAATGVIVLSVKRPGCTAEPAFSRDGRLLGWSEQGGGYRYIDLGAADEPADPPPTP